MRPTRPLRLLLLTAVLLGLALAFHMLANYGSASRSDQGEDLLSSLQLLRDDTGQLGFADIVLRDAQGGFRQATAKDLNVGYTKDALWFVATLRNDSARRVQRYLSVAPPRLEDIRVFMMHGQGRVEELRNGLKVPVAARQVQSRQPVFPLELAPGEDRRIYIRIQSDNAILLEFRHWDPLRFHQSASHADLFNGLQLGALLLFAIYAFVAAASTRERAFIYFGISLLSYALYDFALFQYGLQYVWPHSPDWALRAPGVFLALLTFGIGMVVTELLQTRQYFRLLHYGLVGLAVATLLCIPGLLLGDYSYWVRHTYYLSLALLAANMGAILTAFARGQEGAGLALAAFLLLGFTSLVRLSQILGVFPSLVFWEYSQGWSMVVGGLLMAATLGERVRRMRATQEQAQRKIVATQINARIHAEQAVQERTRELQAAKEKAEDSSRAKSAFLAQLSHELRTPLHSILGYSGLIAGEAEDAEARRRGEAIRRSGRHLLALIDELLDYARGEAGRLQLERQPVHLRELLDSVVEETRGLAREKGARLELRLEESLPTAVLADILRLRQVLINLIANACHHSHANVIRVEASAEAGRNVHHRRICLAVCDDGVGIPEADRERVFQPFEQGSERGTQKGVGLGLSISRQLAALMGGGLILLPLTPGCRFELAFDAEVVNLPATPARKLSLQRHGGPVGRVLVVDDLPDNRELLCAMLQQLGVRVAEAESGAMALEKLGQGGIDLVLSDQLMPGMDGWSLLAEARQRGHVMPFVLVSAALPSIPADSPGFDAMLMKPVEPALLAETVGRCLGLAWLSEEEGESMPALPRPVPPTAGALATLHSLAEQGMVSDIEDWVIHILDAEPEARDFALAVREAVRRLDLAGIQRMTDASPPPLHLA